MGTVKKQVYDPHLLYHAINITVELEYKVPMQRIYDILVVVERNNEKLVDKITPNEVLELLKELGDALENSIMEDTTSTDGSTNLQAKIKELLRLLGCELSDAELNQILKGEMSLDDALSRQARLAWMIIFDIDEDGKSRPDKEIVEHMLLCAETIALETVDLKIQRLAIDNDIRTRQRNGSAVLTKSDNIKTIYRAEAARLDPAVLEQKRNKLRLYIAHMQGYDRDRDRDGGRGVDMTTGIVIDFGDIFIADKGALMEMERNNIEIADIR